MLGIDLSIFRFDYDLTFCSLLMHADGTTYHVYGGRDHTDPQSHLSIPSLIKVLEGTLADHAAYAKAPKPPQPKREYVEDLPPLKKRMQAGKKDECIHCHSVYDFQREHAKDEGRFRRSEIWIYPEPAQAGFEVARDDQTLVSVVHPKSAAAKAGLEKGDRLVSLDGVRVRTHGDIQRALHAESPGAAIVKLTWTRDSKPGSGTLALRKGWKTQKETVFAWRPSKWPLKPQPGFGGRELTPEQLEAAGLPKDGWAFKIGYLVTWGPNRDTGQNAARAGLRRGDIVYSVCGKSDFESMDHYHAWFRLNQKPGTTCEIKYLRGDKHRTAKLPVLK